MQWIADVTLRCPYNTLETKVTKAVLDQVDLDDPNTIPVHKPASDYTLFERCRDCEYGESRAHINDHGQLEGYKVCPELKATVGELHLEDIVPPEEALQ